MAKVEFHPKFHLGEVRSIYYQRLLKKAARVGADAELVRKLETIVYFDQVEALLGSREIEGEPAVLPASLQDAVASDVEKIFLALCYDSALDNDWTLYFGDAEATVAALADELELFE